MNGKYSGSKASKGGRVNFEGQSKLDFELIYA